MTNLTEFTVYAAGAAGAPGEPGWMPFVMMGGIIVLFYFMLIRPQQKRAQEHRKFVENLKQSQASASWCVDGGVTA